ncbi:MAG: ACT domain-containing protein, partial [Lachnospiraceae bacterium]|nr:ACT domain-containing protein [Lachnospiraceae bacterium]
YLENGNVVNSVNFPTVDMGICPVDSRVAILSRNISGMISKFSTVFGDLGINISDFTNKSKGEYAYTLMDIEAKVTDEVVEKLRELDGVIRVRVVK